MKTISPYIILYTTLYPFIFHTCGSGELPGDFGGKVGGRDKCQIGPEVTAVTVNLPYCPLSPPLKCLKSVRQPSDGPKGLKKRDKK